MSGHTQGGWFVEDVLIVGAGASGLVAANRLADAGGVRVMVVDTLAAMGGAHASIATGGFVFDLGLFLFEPSSPFFSDFGLSPSDFVPISHVPRKILDGGRLEPYPFGAAEKKRLLGDWRSLVSLAWGRLTQWRKADARQWAEFHVGAHVLRETGLLQYMQRFNLRDPSEVDPIFCERRMSAVRAMASGRALLRHFRRRQGAAAANPVLVRPASGFGDVYARARRHLAGKGIEFVLGQNLLRIRREAGVLRAAVAGRDREFSRVLWTAPLALASAHVDGAPPAPGVNLQLVSLFFSAERRPEFGGDCLYNFTSDGDWKRLTLLSDYYGVRDGRHYFTVEVNAPAGTAPDAARAAADFLAFGRSRGLLEVDVRHEGSHVYEHAYPCYLPENIARTLEVRESLERLGVECLGKQGRFDYIHSSRQGGDFIRRYLQSGKWRDG